MIATKADLPRVVALGREFHAYSIHADIPFDAEAFETSAGNLIDLGVILLNDRGMFGGMVSPLYFNPAFKVAAELFWYAPKGGSGLLREFEAWARERGAHRSQLSAMPNEHLPAVARIYARAGYRPVETVFMKDL